MCNWLYSFPFDLRKSLPLFLLQWHCTPVQTFASIIWLLFPICNFAFIRICLYTIPPSDFSSPLSLWLYMPFSISILLLSQNVSRSCCNNYTCYHTQSMLQAMDAWIFLSILHMCFVFVEPWTRLTGHDFHNHKPYSYAISMMMGPIKKGESCSSDHRDDSAAETKPISMHIMQ